MEEVAKIVRYVMTGIIWLSFMIPITIVGSQPTTSDTALIVMAALGFAMAFMATFFIWDGAEIIKMSMSDTYKDNQYGGKRKNEDQNADAALLLLDLLSDEERQNIRQRLVQSDDGEIPAIFADDQQQETYRN